MSPLRIDRHRTIAIAALVLIVIAAGLWWATSSRGRREAGRVDGGAENSERSMKTDEKAALDPSGAAFVARLDEVRSQLEAAGSAAKSREVLKQLRDFLGTLPADEASRAIQAYLATQRDSNTKLNVTIKPGGALDDASSLRVFLLDYLGQIDPAAAGALAEQVLSRYTTPDEWALSMRNYAWANPDPSAAIYLIGKMRELLANEDWRNNPSAGYLEAFDTIVHAKGTALTPELTALVRDKDNRGTAHAAYLTLDRLMITDSGAMLKRLVREPDLMIGRELTRANFVARADLGEEQQRLLVEQYLLDPSRSTEELEKFAGLYPNANYMISNNLLTNLETWPKGLRVARDTAALKAVEEWKRDSRFERVKPLLDRIEKRLGAHVSSAGPEG